MLISFLAEKLLAEFGESAEAEETVKQKGWKGLSAETSSSAGHLPVYRGYHEQLASVKGI